MNITIVGTGYVGLVSGTCFAETGNNVICIDIDAEKVAKMKAGEIPIYEPGLDLIFKRNINQNRLRFSTSLSEGIKNADIIFLALPTPPDEDGSADLSYVLGVAEELSHLITDYTVIVNKSTVPVGTADLVTEALAKNLSSELYDVVSNPEFLREGVAVQDFMKPERVVIGTSSEKGQAIMKRLYEPFVRQGNPIIIMDQKSAELTKYAANAFLATKISFMNEISNLCDKVGADVDHIRRGIGTDSRIGKRFLFPGIGYGGSCFPKDVKALFKTAGKYNYDFQILDAVMKVNAAQKLKIAERIISRFGDKSITVAMWGLSFKPNTDDIREAPALYTIDALLAKGYKLRVFDPEARENVKSIYKEQLYYAENMYDALLGADCLVIMTEWNVFRTPSFEKISKLMNSKIIYDGRNLYDTKNMKELGFDYSSIGRPKS